MTGSRGSRATRTDMTRHARPYAVAATALALLCLARGVPATSAAPPRGDLPREVDLLTSVPFDRLTLTDGAVLRIDPVLPRPLPPYDPAKEEKRKRAKKEIPPEGNVGLPGQKGKAAEPGEPDDEANAGTLVIHLVEGDVRDFRVKRASVRSIEYYEDLLIAESERLALARDFTGAFECVLKARARSPSWRGLDDQVNRLLFAEGSVALLENDGGRGLRLLGELFARAPGYPGLADKLATSYGTRAARAFELGLYARGRKILHDVEPMAPGNAFLREVRERFVNRAGELVRSAGKDDGPARLDRLTEALRVWPALEGAGEAYRAAFAASPTLDVAVDDVPRGVGPWERSPADARVVRLFYLPVLARDDEDAAQGKAPGQLAAGVTTTDLGRRVVLRLKADARWSDGSGAAGSADVERALTDAAEPTSPRYSARWADLLDRVEVPDATHVEVRLTRVALKPGAWFLGPVGPAHAAADQGRDLVGDGPFRFGGAGPDRVELLAAGPADARPRGAVRRVKEVRHATASQTLGAFTRGEVSLVEHVPPDRVAGVAANPAFKVGRYARPRLHRIALDGRNPALRNRNLRRGLSYAIDRRTVLEENLLRRPADAANLVSDGPFPKGEYADAPDVRPLGFDPVLARMLVAGARKELGGNPIKLRFEYPATPEAQAAAPRVVEALNAVGKAVGLEVVASERPESELEAELRAGRRFDLAYRVSRCGDPVADAGPLIAPAYDAPPGSNPLASLTSPRILQLLLQLERAPEFPTARGLVIQIDRECRDELPVLPLWQVEDHYAWHTRLKGPKDVCDQLYEGITSWEIAPWYARDPW